MDDPSPSGTTPSALRVVVSNRQDLPVDQGALAALARRVLEGEGVREGELSLSFVSSAEIQDLHERFSGEEGPTDVLSFPLGEHGLLGDVVICAEEARRNNDQVETELRLLVAHGVLHLLGHDHEEAEDRRQMWAKQERYSGVPLEVDR